MENALDGRGEIVIDDALRDKAEEFKGRHMGRPERLHALVRKELNIARAAVGQSHTKHLGGHRLAIQDDLHFAPIDLGGFSRIEHQV